MGVCRAASIVFGFLCVAPCVLAGSRNITIDDQKGDLITGRLPVFLPTPNWAVSPCNGCHAQPDPSQAFDGTWHDATSKASSPRIVQIAFNGTALYVFGILANTIIDGDAFTSTGTNLTFELDNEPAGSFTHIPTDSTEYQYNALFYGNDNIPNGEHQFTLTTQDVTTDNFLVLFDYAIYTVEDDEGSTSASPTTPGSPTSSGSSTSPILTATPTMSAPSPSATSSGNSRVSVAAIAVASIGGVLLLVVLAVLLWYIFRRRRSKAKSVSTEAHPTVGGYSMVDVKSDLWDSPAPPVEDDPPALREASQHRGSVQQRSDGEASSIEPSASNVAALLTQVNALQGEITMLRVERATRQHLLPDVPPPEYRSRASD